MKSTPGHNHRGNFSSKPAPVVPTHAGALSFLPLTRVNFPPLTSWLSAPHVQPWWREDHDPAAVEARYGPSVDGADLTEQFIVELDGQPIGMIQRYRFDDNPEWAETMSVADPPDPAAGIDYLIGSVAHIGKGIGTDMIRRFVEDT